MFGPKTRLFKIFDFEVKLDASWFFLALLIAWTLAQGYFPALYEGLPQKTYWSMGVLGALGIFFSIIFHELSHSLVARRYNLPIKGITLFIFGGVAEMESEPPSAKAEFMIAIAGPIASFILAVSFYGLYVIAQSLQIPDATQGIVRYLAMINMILAVFNLVPAFPMDGGRILRAALWQWTSDLPWATQIASRAGTAFGIILMVLGLINIATGNFIGGLWWILIGLFIQSAATSHYIQLQVRLALEGEKVSRFMVSNPITVGPDTTLRDFIEDYVYRHHHKMFPVLENKVLTGCVTTRRIKETPRKQWDEMVVRQIMEPCTKDNTISADEDAMKALEQMKRSGNSRLMVVEKGDLQGIVALKDLMELFALKMELEKNEI